MHRDLFPETLLVSISNGIPMTDSRKIAEHFQKRHDNVVRMIRAYLSQAKDPRGLLNFEESSYCNEQNKLQPMYLLTKDGFTFIVGKFKGEIAEVWQWDFIDAFNALEAELRSKTERFARALDAVRPNLRPVTEATERGYNRTEIGLLLDKSPASITYHRRSARRLGLLAA